MKKLLIIPCFILFVVFESSSVGLDSKAMALRTSASRLSTINKMKELPIGLSANSYVSSAEASDDQLQNARVFALLLAINFTTWDKYKVSVDGGSKIGTLIPLLLMAQLPISKFSSNSSSLFMRNFIVGAWLGYFMNGWKDSDGVYTYKNTFSVFMIGLLATLYLNEFFALESFPLLFYATLKMGVIFEKDRWKSNDFTDSESWTKFGVFPAIGAEYFLGRSLAIFAAIGYNPFGWAEFGLRLNIGK